jgi:hypothetical protein
MPRCVSVIRGRPIAPIARFRGGAKDSDCSFLCAAQCEAAPAPIEFSSAIKPKTYVKFARRAI